MTTEERQCADLEEADALFAQAEELAALAKAEPRREERRLLLTESAEAHRLAWERLAAARGEGSDAARRV